MTIAENQVSTRELREELSYVLGETLHAGRRFTVTRNGKPAAAIDDLHALEEFEMAQDIAAYEHAKRTDDGVRITLEDFKASLD